MNKLNLLEVDKLEVTVLVDNYTDALLVNSADTVRRPETPPPNLLLAEHGLSCLLKVYVGLEDHIVLMDAGASATCLFHNADVLKADLNKVESVIIGHGHFNHFGGLVDFLKNADKRISLVLHPDVFLKRRLKIPIIGVVDFPGLDKEGLKKTGVVFHEVNEASTIVSGLIMVSGEVQRVTDFEKGFPWSEAKIDGKWVVDSFHDDQGLAINVKGKGLVVISGCSHAGIIKIVKHFQKAAGMSRVHAVLGGFHLTGPTFDPIIAPTITEMKKISPNFVVPMHCTGWKAINQFASEMHEQFLLNTVEQPMSSNGPE